MSGTGEPTPSAGDDIPESVLRELKTVFADPEEDVADVPVRAERLGGLRRERCVGRLRRVLLLGAAEARQRR